MSCPFCAMMIDASLRPADFRRFEDHMVFTPLNPVTWGHLLVVPTLHAPQFSVAERICGRAMRVAARLVGIMGNPDANLIVSQGAAATQTVRHLHVHIVPRKADDGLTLPWTAQR